MTSESSIPVPPGGASDLPSGNPTSWAPPRAPASTSGIVEHIPDTTAARGLGLMAVGGLLAQLLFFGQAPGINVVVWIAFVLAAALFVRRPGARIDRYDLWLPVSALAFAALCAWRTDAMLLAFNLLATGSLTLAAVVALGGQPLTRSTARTVATYAARAMAMYLFGAAYLAGGLRAIRPAREAVPSRANRVLRGLLIAAPLVLVFAALFGAADAVFGTLLNSVFRIDFDRAEIMGRTVLTILAAWLLGGTLVAGWLRRETSTSASASTATASELAGPRLGSIEATVVLACINVLFGVFVLLQAAYLFGGLDTLALTGMTYSEYARRGFGELVVAALFAGLLLVALGAITATPGRAQRVLSALLCVGIFVIVLSAFQRIGLYQDAYGWTELRFYTVAGICWLAMCSLAALVLVGRDRVRSLPIVALALGLVVAVTCNVVGPQAFVTEQNVRRAADPALVPAGGQSGLDVSYLYTLDADAIRVMAAAYPILPADVQATLSTYLPRAKEYLVEDANRGWPSWNYARAAALEALTAAGY